MPVLAYGVSLVHDSLAAPPVGVANAPVHEVENTILRAWYSEVEEGTFSGTERVTKAALEFHRLISALFREGTVLPFRFPTILDAVDDLHVHLDEKGTWYYRALQQIEGLAQFEARILSKTKLPPEAESGKAYLAARKKQHDASTAAVQGLLQGLEPVLREHHVKESQQATRVYLLLERSSIASFRDIASKIAIPEAIEIRLSGPWPPTEFLPPEDEVL